MTGPRLNIPAQMIRLVATGSDGAVTVTELTGQPAFRVELVRPRDQVSDEGPPRAYPPWIIRWRTGIWGPQGAVPGGSSRIDVNGAAYELLGRPKTLMHGTRAVGYEVSAQPVAELYPFVGSLTEQDGTVVDAAIHFARWSPSETHNTTGEYEDYDAEAPAEYRDLVKRNRQIRMGGKTYRIMTVVTETTVPRALFRLRRAGG